MNTCLICKSSLGKRNKYFCSWKCYEKSNMRKATEFKKNHEPVRDQYGEKNHMWKGDKVGYNGVHTWVRSRLGTPAYCSKCHSHEPQRYEWANISGMYRREIGDWIRLCTKCHFRFDGKKLGGNMRCAKSIGEKYYLSR